MNRLRIFIMINFFLVFNNSSQLNAFAPLVYSDSSRSIQAVESELLFLRLQEIKNLDQSSLNYSERKLLRNEVKTIKKKLKANNGGVYLSTGALLLVIILLIILL